MATSDWFTKGFGAAVEDVRAKLIDEGWFGRNAPSKGAPEQNRSMTNDVGGHAAGEPPQDGPFPKEQLQYPEAPVKFYDFGSTRTPPPSPPEHSTPTPSSPDHGISH